MLNGPDTTIRGFSLDNTFLEPLCRPCTVRKIGPLRTGLLERGGRALGHPDAQPIHTWQTVDLATDNGYDHSEGCEDSEHAKLRADEDLMWSRDPGYCPGCADVTCFECGTVLYAEITTEAAAEPAAA